MSKTKPNKPNAEALRESCGKCQSQEFSIAKNDSQRRYCTKCNNVWAPMTKEQLEVKAVLADNLRLKVENKELKELLKKQGTPIGKIEDVDQQDLFA